MIIEVNIFYTNTRTCGLFLFKGLWPEEEQQTLFILGPKGTSGTVASGPGVGRNLGRMRGGPGGQPAPLSTGLLLDTHEALCPRWLLGTFGGLALPAPASLSVKQSHHVSHRLVKTRKGG